MAAAVDPVLLVEDDTAIATVMLGAAFLLLLVINLIQGRERRRLGAPQ